MATTNAPMNDAPLATLPAPTTTTTTDADLVAEEAGEETFVDESFANVAELRAHGVQAADIAKLTRHGFTTVGLVATGAGTGGPAGSGAARLSSLPVRARAGRASESSPRVGARARARPRVPPPRRSPPRRAASSRASRACRRSA